MSQKAPEKTREALIGAAVMLILRQGFTATSVDQICREAGITKGALFHHYPNKIAIGKAAIEWWSAMGTSLYADAWKDGDSADGLDQLNQMFDIMIGFTKRPDQACVCVIGMMSQELAQQNEEIRETCHRELEVWNNHVAALLNRAKQQREVIQEFDADDVAWYLNSIWQGSMLIGKTCQSPQIIQTNLEIARSTINGFFGNAKHDK